MTDDDVQRSGTATAPVQDDVADEDLGAGGEQIMALLSEHVPLSLLLDLAARTSPDSEHLLAAEGGAERMWWQPPTTGEP